MSAADAMELPEYRLYRAAKLRHYALMDQQLKLRNHLWAIEECVASAAMTLSDARFALDEAIMATVQS